MSNWTRASKENPCPVCKKPDWCCHGTQFTNCMRVVSDKLCTNGGWLHPKGGTTKFRPLPPKPRRQPTIDACKLMKDYLSKTLTKWVREFAEQLGVNTLSLSALGCAWAADHNAWAFSMKDCRGKIIGIRLRDADGNKWAVTGSWAGLFYAEGAGKTVAICEGPTDTAAAMTIGLCAVGRPSCLGCEGETNRLLQRKGASRAVLISDNDSPGYRGAEKLQTALSIPSVIWVPPAKDLRSFVQLGGTASLIESLTNSLIWTQPKRNNSSTTLIVPRSVLQP